MKLLLLLASLLTLVVANEEDNSSHLRRRLQSSSHLIDPKSIVLKVTDAVQSAEEDAANHRDDGATLNKRRFVSYESSPWERQWLEHVGRWSDERSICDVLQNSPEQLQYLHDFMKLTCSAHYQAPHESWCIIDDDYRPMYYNTANRDTFELMWKPPFDDMVLDGPHKPIIPGPEHEHIVSKFTFFDETTREHYVEYIEPLVSHLRHPLHGCPALTSPSLTMPQWLVSSRGWILPPPPSLRRDRALFFDAGASEWADGIGGSSLKFFHDYWSRVGVSFNEIWAFEPTRTVRDFYDTVPLEFHDRVHFQQCFVSSRPADDAPDTPFVPQFVSRMKHSPNDYVLFKLDIDSAPVEHGNIDFILNDPLYNDVDEIVWEHHVQNYLMAQHWGNNTKHLPLKIEDSYQYFLKMRQRGIRAHSWV